ncbi:heavy-metal-associated domain-containing protein [Clostridium saccharobutylicum]|uniref:HMA domain-containing protein n=1 Tax=Clostridium saccharobutylicum TaxID=169679 RepID=A0A1S8N498_CLOSA|nr:heavy metal-associated domain-containing protein [Clostridium saccharobutylicum]OOM11198.1 hypothetical protein CLOSAC_27550 [Clostridium saccharobutylicum]
MKSIIKICNMESQQDIKIIQKCVVKNAGIIAIQTSLSKKEITIIYNNFLDIKKIVENIEDLGYIVI